MSTPTLIAGYLALFTAFGLFFLFIHLVMGKFIRPKNPNTEKLEIYECGEPTIGSSFVQFDIRFYVVALLFIIFDVEIAFFFPWANVFGKATHLADPNLAVVQPAAEGADPELTAAAAGVFRELGVPASVAPRASGGGDEGVDDFTAAEATTADIRNTADTLAVLSIMDILTFFGVLLVGFAYVWRRGDLDWVRAVHPDRAPPIERVPPSVALEHEPALSV